jgi:hypothetical protein
MFRPNSNALEAIESVESESNPFTTDKPNDSRVSDKYKVYFDVSIHRRRSEHGVHP